MEKFIVKFGYYEECGNYAVQSSKPIPAKDEQEASWILKDQFESFEGEECNIISITKTN